MAKTKGDYISDEVLCWEMITSGRRCYFGVNLDLDGMRVVDGEIEGALSEGIEAGVMEAMLNVILDEDSSPSGHELLASICKDRLIEIANKSDGAGTYVEWGSEVEYSIRKLIDEKERRRPRDQ